jgi:outer membrane protein assembly factor BamB
LSLARHPNRACRCGCRYIRTDKDGNLFVVTLNTAQYLRNYDNSGNLLWTLSNTQVGFSGVAFCGMAVDANGYVYISDSSNLAKISPSGSVVYVKTLPYAAYLNPGVPLNNLAIDKNNCFYYIDSVNKYKIHK